MRRSFWIYYLHMVIVVAVGYYILRYVKKGGLAQGIDYRYFCNSDIFVSGGIYEITVGNAYDLPYRKDAVKK